MAEEGNHTEDAAFGIAALSLLDALIVTLLDRQQITEEELDDAFIAAIEAHQNARGASNIKTNQRVSVILERLRVRGSSVLLD